MENRVITVEQLNRLLNYLAQKPYIEVHQVIADLQKLPPIVSAEIAPE